MGCITLNYTHKMVDGQLGKNLKGRHHAMSEVMLRNLPGGTRVKTPKASVKILNTPVKIPEWYIPLF
jgi:hypothetical protein